MGSHVSAVPNHQVHRNTPLYTRANVAYFGTFGYELDLNRLTREEQEEVREQIRFMKEYREILQYGTFYRLESPFEGNVTGWMSVSEDKKTAVVGWYRVLNSANPPFTRMRLMGLEPEFYYEIEGLENGRYGDDLMHIGLCTADCLEGAETAGKSPAGDYHSRVYVLKAK